jgi:hypothetical protein
MAHSNPSKTTTTWERLLDGKLADVIEFGKRTEEQCRKAKTRQATTEAKSRLGLLPQKTVMAMAQIVRLYSSGKANLASHRLR